MFKNKLYKKRSVSMLQKENRASAGVNARSKI